MHRLLQLSLLTLVGLAIGSGQTFEPLSPPRLTRLPESIVRAPAGSSVSWTCQAVGSPNPLIRWTKEAWSREANEIISRQLISANGTLTLRDLSPADEGRYQCWASNLAGVAAREVTLYVIGEGGGSEIGADKEDVYSLKINEIIRNTIAEASAASSEAHQLIKPEAAVKHRRRSAEVVHAETALVDMDAFVRLVGALLRRSDGGKTTFPTTTSSSTSGSGDWLTPVQALSLLNYTGCVGGAQFQVLDCRPFGRFRSVTGICNNLGQERLGKTPPEKVAGSAKSWGSQMTPFRRLLPARYEDGLLKPPGWFEEESLGKTPKLPNPRLVSESLLSTRQVTPDPTANHLLMQWGQFLAHDLTFAAAPPRSWNILEDNVLDCRRTCQPRHVEPCFSVRRTTSTAFLTTAQESPTLNSTNSDKRKLKTARRSRKLKKKKKVLYSSFSITKPECIELVRSAELCGSGLTSLAGGRLVPREQVNALTSFIDGSQIYGSSVELARHLREKSPDRGLLKVNVINGREYLPLSEDHPMDCQLQPRAGGKLGGLMDCFLAGDHRANEHIGLLVMHNLWLRQHNRLARELRRLHPDWSGERLFQEARLIVGAQLQLITYRDWLPKIIGKKAMARLLGPYRGYNASLDASISNVFATAAMRFGHTLVRGELVRGLLKKKKTTSTSANNQTTSKVHPNMNMRALFFASHLLHQPTLADSLLTGLAATPLKRPGLAEQAISVELTDHLFERSRQAPLDLASLNIQRGRDHGLPAYNSWRRYCSLKEVASFEQLPLGGSTKAVRQKLASLYGTPDRLDLWVGGILEEIVPEGEDDEDSLPKVGPTFRCLLVEQFRRLRDGDRHWFEAEGIFTQDQRAELQKGTSLAEIVCSNSDDGGVREFPVDAFLLPNEAAEGNRLVNCSSLPRLDLSKW